MALDNCNGLLIFMNSLTRSKKNKSVFVTTFFSLGEEPVLAGSISVPGTTGDPNDPGKLLDCWTGAIIICKYLTTWRSK